MGERGLAGEDGSLQEPLLLRIEGDDNGSVGSEDTTDDEADDCHPHDLEGAPRCYNTAGGPVRGLLRLVAVATGGTAEGQEGVAAAEGPPQPVLEEGAAEGMTQSTLPAVQVDFPFCSFSKFSLG